jgi:ornithine cyclodeaminase/alanine dehydrogenase-like protein (mu-crystallin family)
VTTAQEAVSAADVVLSLTSSATPVLSGKWLRPHAMVCAIGAATPDRRELDDEAMRGAVVVESREAALKEAGDIVIANAQIEAEIGELLSGRQLQSEGRPIIFKSVGIAIEDLAAAKLVYDKLKSRTD